VEKKGEVMKKVHIESTKYTPEILLDSENCVIEMRGKSYPENTFEFYKPVIEWLEEFLKNPPCKKLTVNMEIIYFNSSSSKFFFDFFDILYENRDKIDIEINWIYDEENESAEEAGEDFIDDFEDLKINLVTKK
jgi:hypothetical protein